MEEQIQMEEQLKQGDVVRLKSGGPMMTVLDPSQDTVALVYWHEGLQDFKGTEFEAFLLLKV